MKIALVSLNQEWENKPVNRNISADKFRLASTKGADLIVFPEMTLTGFTMNPKPFAETIKDSETIQFFSKKAREFKIGVIFGMIVNTDNYFENKAIFINKKGRLIANYTKTHPFSYSGEDKVFKAGNKIVDTNFEGINFGLTICYDLRFPELYQILSKTNQVIVNIANWPKARVEHWNCLLQARAIENQCYIIGVNRIGIDGNNLEYTQSSLVFSPKGNHLFPKEKNDDILIFDIEKEEVAKWRQQFPMKKDRKTAWYKENL